MWKGIGNPARLSISDGKRGDVIQMNEDNINDAVEPEHTFYPYSECGPNCELSNQWRKEHELVEKIRQISQIIAPDPEPGQLITHVTCPCCGNGITIEYGDDPGEIVAIGPENSHDTLQNA